MDVDEENPSSVSLAEPSATVIDDQTPVSTIDPTPLTALQPIILSLVPPPIVPPIALIPSVFVPIFRSLVPLPVCPPVLRPPFPQNGEMRASDSDSDRDDSGRAQAASGSAVEYEISEESRQFRERQEKTKQEFLMKRRASALAVPTNDMAVQTHLRQLGEPITLLEKERWKDEIG